MRRLSALAVGLVAALLGCQGPPSSLSPEGPEPDNLDPNRPRVILFVGDGMGRGQIAAASYFRHGEPDKLHLLSLPIRGQTLTASLDGTADSASSATAMAAGVMTHNGRIALDRDGQSVDTLFKLATDRGIATGIVTTTLLPHATIAAFSAHNTSRHNLDEIAVEQATVTQPDVLLGGGSTYFDSGDDDSNLLDEIGANGYTLVRTSSQMRAALLAKPPRMFGTFAAGHLPYVADRDDSHPSLTDMTMAALQILNRDPEGFVLVVEGGRIDHASHSNHLGRAVGETLEFDDCVAAVDEWAQKLPGVSILITSDHETGGLQIVDDNGAGTLPTVSWRWGSHTNARVGFFGRGTAATPLADELSDHRWIYRAITSELTGDSFVAPQRQLVPSGHMADLRHVAVQQTIASQLPGAAQLDAMRIDADAYGLAIGIDGLFPYESQAVAILIDVDYGDGTGHAGLPGALADSEGEADVLLSTLVLAPPSSSPGFGADVAVVSIGGRDCLAGQRLNVCGLRGLRPPYGDNAELGGLSAAVSFDDNVRPGYQAAFAREESGMEVYIEWSALYPLLSGAVPPGATVAVFAVLVDDVSTPTNQALPSFASAVPATAIPGVVVFSVDGNVDGIGDGDTPPVVVQ